MNNFILGIQAIILDIHLFMISLFQNQALLWFGGGIIISTLISGFILTKNPKHIPVILRHSNTGAFEKIAKTDHKGTYEFSFAAFSKMYTNVRRLFLLASMLFFLMIIAIVIFG